MATINLINGTLKGRVGDVQGQIIAGRAFLKSAIFSKAPQTLLQKQSLHAFQALCRFTAKIAAQTGNFSPIPTKGMSNHNALASFFKIAINEKVFNWNAVAPLFLPIDMIHITSFSLDTDSRYATITSEVSDVNPPTPDDTLVFVVFDNEGYIYYIYVGAVIPIDIQPMLPFREGRSFYASCFVIEKTTGGNRLLSFSFMEVGGVDYSLEEQDTGVKWLDGSPIYQRTLESNFEVTQEANQLQISFPSKGATAIIDYEMIMASLDPAVKVRTSQSPYFYGNLPIFTSFLTSPPNTLIYLDVYVPEGVTKDDSAEIFFWATIWYIKSNPLPSKKA